MSKRRVVITGMGVVSPLGETVDGMWDNLCAGKSGIKTVTRWDFSKFPVRFGGECTGFDVTKYQDLCSKFSEERLLPKRLDRFGQFGVAAALSAVDDSKIDFTKEDPFRCGVLIGSGIGGIETLEEQNKILVAKGVQRLPEATGNACRPQECAFSVRLKTGDLEVRPLHRD